MSIEDRYPKPPRGPAVIWPGDESEGNLPMPESAEDQIAVLTEKLEQLEAEKKELQDRVLRGAAELENFKKRTRRDIADSARYAAEPLIRDLLTVVDNLDRAVAHASGSAGDQSLVEGVTLVLKSLQDTLRRHGVTPVEARVGDAFDPNLHEAVEQRETDGEPNLIVEQWQPGYKLHERLLRPARVSVSGPRRASVANGEDRD